MPPRMLFVASGILAIWLCRTAHSQSTPPEGDSQESQASLLTTWTSSDLVLAAHDFQEGSVALESFGDTLESILAHFGNDLVAISENFAAMSVGFDPLGMKSDF